MKQDTDIFVLGIESSCDETSVAVVKNGREVLSNVISSQIDIHEKFGGVVPEIASRNHVEAISNVTKKALEEAKVTTEDIDAIACTYGPGLVGALLVGVSYAKALSYATGKPLIGTNHLEGHIAANYITHKDLKPPFLCMVVSGGHTHLIHIKDYKEFEILGKTKDDAIGEAFDKVARVIGLGYPGGPKVDKLAKEGEPNIVLPKTHFENLDFSFSGIKTAVINLHHKQPDINKADLCASFEKTVTDILLTNVQKAMKEYDIHTVALAGGVSANSYIRERFKQLEKTPGVQVYYPEPILCTDNGAMIAAAGYYNYIHKQVSDLTLNAIPNLKIEAKEMQEKE
ncbi:MAG: tRNA (adenosine(37)-N6)-threonylcarbamoyltransferase complex transferase subunit TsaD [Clostridia bacterium]